MRYLDLLWDICQTTYSSLSSLNCHKKKNTYQKRPKIKPENIEWKPTKVKEKQNKTTNNQWHAHSQQNSKPDHRESTRTWRILCMKLYYQLNWRGKNLLSRMWNWLELASCLLRYQRWRANGTRWLFVKFVFSQYFIVYTMHLISKKFGTRKFCNVSYILPR